MSNRIAMAGCINLDKLGTTRIWIPPHGKPFWVRAGKPNAGPDLTDEEIKKYLKNIEFSC